MSNQNTEKHQERTRISMQKLRTKRIAQGLCRDCGNLALPGSIRCRKHLLKYREYRRTYDSRHQQERSHQNAEHKRQMREQHRCTMCDAPLEPDDNHITCPNCRTRTFKQGVYHEAFEKAHCT